MKGSLYIITGCSRGLGRALKEKLCLDPGNQVLGISRTQMEESNNFFHLGLDLADPKALIMSLGKIFPSGDFQKVVLINNAGWIGEIAPLGKLDPNGILDIFSLNLIAPAILINGYVKQYQNSESEKIVINISSGAAQKELDGWSGYCGSKAGLNQLSMVAEEESRLKNSGIKYYALSPGIIDTEMQSEIRSTSLHNFSRGESFRSYKTQGDLVPPDSVAEKICYLIENSKNFKGVLLDVRNF